MVEILRVIQCIMQCLMFKNEANNLFQLIMGNLRKVFYLRKELNPAIHF